MNETYATEGNGSIGPKRPQANVLKAEEAKENNASRRNGIAVPPLFMPERLCGIGIPFPSGKENECGKQVSAMPHLAGPRFRSLSRRGYSYSSPHKYPHEEP